MTVPFSTAVTSFASFRWTLALRSASSISRACAAAACGPSQVNAHMSSVARTKARAPDLGAGRSAASMCSSRKPALKQTSRNM